MTRPGRGRSRRAIGASSGAARPLRGWMLVVSSLALSAPALAAGPQVAPSSVAAEYERDVERFVEAGRDFHYEASAYARTALEAKRARLEALAEQTTALEEDRLHLERLGAIGRYEAFLRRHPAHPEHTPDAMFRLAELYFEKGAVDLERFERDPRTARLLGDLEPSAVAFGDAIGLYDDLVRRFPEHRHGAAARYVLGYLYEETGEPGKALAAFDALLERHPKSAYAPEAALRSGEIYFDAGDWDRAAAAYERAAAYEDGRFYDKALYKLAWTHFQRFDYDRAIRQFASLIAHYDSRGAGEGIAAELRSEAIEYLARSLAEDDWDGDGVVDPDAGVERAWAYLSQGERYEREVLLAYANALYELHEESKYLAAVEVYDRLQSRDTHHPDNPELAERSVAILDIVGRRDEASQRRLAIIDQFNPRTAWYRANADDAAAREKADAMVELAMRQRAQAEHRAAQDAREDALARGDTAGLVNAADAYGRAADAYRAYLRAFPESSYAPDVTYFLGETLFYTGRFEEAADVYAQVRDQQRAPRYVEPAAFSAVKALERSLDLGVAEGRLPRGASPTTELDDDDELALAEVPTPVRRWVGAIDTYVDRGLSRPGEADTAARLSYQAALVLSRTGAPAEGRQRAERLVDQAPDSEIAGLAATLIIDSYRRENDWENIERWAKLVDERGIGKAEDQSRLRAEIRTFKLGAQFQQAEALLDEERYAEAAVEFEKIVDEDRAGALPFADKALYNAGLAYEKARRFDSAARLFERIVTEPRFSDSEFVEDALFQLAENHNRFFDFGAATERYLALVDRNPRHASAPDALLQAAALSENEGQYLRAARAYERYAEDYPSRDDARAAWLDALRAYGRAGAQEEIDRVSRRILASFEVVPDAGGLVVRATLELGNAALARRRKADAAREYQRAIATFAARGLQPGSADAALAAEAQFRICELKFAEYEALRLKGNLGAMGRQIKRKQLLLAELEAAYADIFPYKALEWTFAGYFRIGQIYQEFADMLYAAPPPEGLSRDELEVYQIELEDIGVRFEDTAVQRYEVTVVKARELKFKNEWTDRALRAINKYRPADFPLQREPRRELVYFPFLTPVLHPTAGHAAGPAAEVTP